MRFKLRFLKRLEVKLAHLVCLLLSKTRQNLPPPPSQAMMKIKSTCLTSDQILDFCPN